MFYRQKNIKILGESYKFDLKTTWFTNLTAFHSKFRHFLVGLQLKVSIENFQNFKKV